MRAAAISALIQCDGAGADLLPTIDSLARQAGTTVEILLLVSKGTDDRLLRYTADLCRRPGVRMVEVGVEMPGAIRNAGMRESRGAYVTMPDAGDRLDPRFAGLAAARLDTSPEVAFVTSWVREETGVGAATLRLPPGYDLATVFARPDAIHSASLFRRTAWQAVGGFDEDLTGLEAWEFWLRLLREGWQGAGLDSPLLIHRISDRAPWRRTLEQVREAGCLRAVYERHRDALAADPARLLAAQERALRALTRRHGPLLAERTAHVEELAAVTREIESLDADLAAAGRTTVEWGDLRRALPLDANWGYGRGKPIDRYYIERFLETHAADVRGTVLEVQEAEYTERFGGHRVERSDVVDLNPLNPHATLVTDLRDAPAIADATYDCIILTQTLHVIDDMGAVLRECARILKPGGVLLATLPCLSRVCLEYGDEGDFWRVTEAGARRCFAEAFPADRIEVQSCGSVLSSVAFLQGLACHELTEEELEAYDPYVPLLVTVRAVKPSGAEPAAALERARSTPRPNRTSGRSGTGVILLYHRVAEPASDLHGLAVSPDQFWAHMAYLGRHCRPMTLLDLAAHVADGDIPPGAAAVTFDDGYADNLETSSPILSEHGVPATFFVSTGGPEEEFWWDTLEWLFVSANPLPGRLELTRGEGRHCFATATAAERRAAHWALHRMLVGATLEERESLMTALLAWSGLARPRRSSHRRLTPGELRALAARPGHTLGAHGLQHLALPHQPLAVQRREITEEKSRLEGLLGVPVRAFAYPFGAYSDEAVATVQEASFEVAVTCDAAPVRTGSDVLRLPRIEVASSDAKHFAEVLRQHSGP